MTKLKSLWRNIIGYLSFENNPRNFVRYLHTTILILIVAVAITSTKVFTNDSRIERKFDANDKEFQMRLDRVVVALEIELRSDCPFKREVYLLPNEARVPSNVVNRLSDGARVAYYGKQCQEAEGPNGKPLGPLPTLTPRPSSPTR